MSLARRPETMKNCGAGFRPAPAACCGQVGNLPHTFRRRREMLLPRPIFNMLPLRLPRRAVVSLFLMIAMFLQTTQAQSQKDKEPQKKQDETVRLEIIPRPHARVRFKESSNQFAVS